MEFRLLGPFDLHDPTTATHHHLGGPVQRTLLAHLLLANESPIPTTTLTTRLWGTTATEGSTSTLQVHILRLRRLLKAATCTATIDTTPAGYRLTLNTNTTDTATFQSLLHTASQAGTKESELTALTTALQLWRADLLTDVTADWPRFPEAQLLLHQHTQARTRKAELQLALNRQPDLNDLEALITDHPDHEHPRLLLMQALHRLGRRKEALATYDAAYRYAASLGLDPSQELKNLQHRVLAGTPTPHTLPTRGFFVGRTKELTTPKSPTHLITGLPGAGKSALAQQLAHQWNHQDGTLHADLSTTTPEAALTRFLNLLQLSPPSDVEEQQALFRMHTTTKQLLVIVDNATTTAQVRTLLPGHGSATIVTSRRPLPALDATRTHLTELSTAEARQLLGKFTHQNDPQAAHRIIEYCDHLPLAVRIAAGTLAARPHWSLKAFADLLEPEDTRLDHLTCEDLSVRKTIISATGGITEAQRRALARPHQAAKETLEQLVDEGLIRQDHTVPTLVRLAATSRTSRLEAA